MKVNSIWSKEYSSHNDQRSQLQRIPRYGVLAGVKFRA
jgi:hypothetical protein